MALATIVAVRGSTYRRPGARLLVPEEGAPIGNISGGCLEGDVADMARVVMDEGTARLAGWDLTADDDAVWGLGLGCNGAIEVFIEPAEQAAHGGGRAARGAGGRAADLRRHGRRVRGRRGRTRSPDRRAPRPRCRARRIPGIGDAWTPRPWRPRANCSAAERSEVRTLTGGVRAFVEVLEPPLAAVRSAGPATTPSRSPAPRPASAGNAIVVDDRPAFLTAERYPDAAGFVHVEAPELTAKTTPIDDRTRSRS